MNARRDQHGDDSQRKGLDPTTVFMWLMFVLAFLIVAIELWVPHGHTP